MRKATLLAVILLSLVGGASARPVAAAPSDRAYTFTTLYFPGAIGTYPMGSNAQGDIVGSYLDSSNVRHAFLLRSGKYTTLDFPGSNVTSTQANAIGPNGDIVGNYSLASPAPAGNVHAFRLTSRGEWSTVDYPERGPGHLMEGGPFAILADGTMVGCVHDGLPATAMYGYTMGPSGASRFDYPSGSPFAMHYGVTPDGKTIVGTYRLGAALPTSWHGYLLDSGSVVSFDVPGKAGTQAQGINPSRVIAGMYSEKNASRGFLADTRGSLLPADWQFTMIDVPGAAQTILRGVDAAGDLLGYYVDAAGKTHGFTATQAVAAAAASAPAPRITPPSTGDAGLASAPDGALTGWAYAGVLGALAGGATLLLFRRRASRSR